MKTDTPQTVYLKDYTPPAFWIDTVDLDFDIDAGGTTVSATLAMRRNAARPGQPLVLDGEELQTLALSVDGQDWPYTETPGTLTLTDLPDAFEPGGEEKGRSLAGPALHPDIAAHQRC